MALRPLDKWFTTALPCEPLLPGIKMDRVDDVLVHTPTTGGGRLSPGETGLRGGKSVAWRAGGAGWPRCPLRAGDIVRGFMTCS